MGALRRWPSLALGAGLLLSACTGGIDLEGPTLPSPASPLPPVRVGDQPVAAVVERVRPAVVSVTTNLLAPEPFSGETSQGAGTGFIVREDGVVVTNFHVVEGALSIEIFTADGRDFQARAIGGDPNADLAVLKIEADGLPVVELGDSDQLGLGETVVALGFALALEGGPSVTSGIVSAMGRAIDAGIPGGAVRTLEDLIQTDAAINPGNSGGPLVDLSGRVVGINTAAAQAAENIGFAIAINRARPIIEESLREPEAPAAFLGVSTQDVDPLVAAQYGLSVEEGALVVSVAPDGPADQAGIEPRDVIVAIGGDEIRDSADVRDAVLDRGPGDPVEVTVIHGQERRTVTVSLGVRPLPVSAG